MAFIRVSEDTGLLDAYRQQVRVAISRGTDPHVVLLMWNGQAGVSRDDLIDILKEEAGERTPWVKPAPGGVQPSPFA